MKMFVVEDANLPSGFKLVVAGSATEGSEGKNRVNANSHTQNIEL